MTSQTPDQGVASPETTFEEAEAQRYREFLPPGVRREQGRGLIRIIDMGNGRTRWRPVSLSQEEAQKKRMDYFHPEFGWLVDGFKLERDRGLMSRFQDNSTPNGKPMEI